jgi:hypothetical protein
MSDQPTALAVTAQAAPRYVRGSDDRTHLDYDLLITNWLPGTVTLNSIKVLTPSGRPLLELAGEELAAHTHLISAAPPTASIPPRRPWPRSSTSPSPRRHGQPR